MEKFIKIIAITINIIVIVGAIATSMYYGASGTGNILDLLAWFTHSIPFGLSLYQKLILILFIIPTLNIVALLLKSKSDREI